jgi:hypothetical protein
MRGDGPSRQNHRTNSQMKYEAVQRRPVNIKYRFKLPSTGSKINTDRVKGEIFEEMDLILIYCMQKGRRFLATDQRQLIYPRDSTICSRREKETDLP